MVFKYICGTNFSWKFIKVLFYVAPAPRSKDFEKNKLNLQGA